VKIIQHTHIDCSNAVWHLLVFVVFAISFFSVSIIMWQTVLTVTLTDNDIITFTLSFHFILLFIYCAVLCLTCLHTVTYEKGGKELLEREKSDSTKEKPQKMERDGNEFEEKATATKWKSIRKIIKILSKLRAVRE